MSDETVKAILMLSQLNFGFNVPSPEFHLTFTAEFSPIRGHMLRELGFKYHKHHESGMQAEYRMGEVRVFLNGYRGPKYYT